MTRYIMENGDEFTAKNARDLAEQMRSDSFNPGDTLEEWMRETATRLAQSTGVVITYDNVDQFVAGLVRVGLVKQKDD